MANEFLNLPQSIAPWFPPGDVAGDQPEARLRDYAASLPQPAPIVQEGPFDRLRQEAASAPVLDIYNNAMGMTHQPEQPNPAQPYIDALRGYLQSPDLTPQHLPGTAPEDYLRELYRNPDILNKGIDQARNFIWTGTTRGATSGPQMSTQPERLTGAAVRLDNGKVYTGTTHGEAAYAAAQDQGVSMDDLYNKLMRDKSSGDSFFMTDSGRVVTRGEAGRIATEAKQFVHSGGTKAENIDMSSGPQEPPGITAYHGSPHDFERFDLSKIGTGEGAQAYGHGLYFAENEGVAKEYRDQVKDMVLLNRNNKRMSEIAREMEKYKKPGTMREFNDPRGYQLADEYDRLMAEKMAPGRMYQVAIKANPEHFLDWDKPLSEQSGHVKDVLRKHGINVDEYQGVSHPEDLRINEPEYAAQLREAGIPGIKYLDQGSRIPADQIRVARDRVTEARQNIKKAPDSQVYRDQLAARQQELEDLQNRKETRNYVVFDDKLIDILKKYGLAGLGALPAMNAYHYQDNQ